MVKRLNPLLFSALAAAFLIYLKIVPLPESKILTPFPYEKINFLEGKIISDPVKLSDSYYSLKLKADLCKSSDGIKSFCCGKVKVLISSKIVEAFYPDKLFSSNGKIFSYSYLIENGARIKFNTKYVMTENKREYFICDQLVSCDFENNFSGHFQKMRGTCRIQFKRLMSAWGRAGGLFLALLSGSKEYLEENMKNIFRLSGLSHILALSGMHLALISNLTDFAHGKNAVKTGGIIIKNIMVIAFVWFAGLSPSLLRALISLMIVSLCRIFKIREKESLSLLAVTFLIHIMIRAEDLFEISFILSYAALTGILVLGPVLKGFCSAFLTERINSSFSSSCAAVIFTSPVSIKMSGMLSPAGIICTLFASPLITVFLYSGLVLMVFSFFVPCLCSFSSFLMNLQYNVITFIIKFWQFIPVFKVTLVR